MKTLILILILSPFILTQITVEEYKSAKQALSVKKIELQNEIADLNSEIVELKNSIPELEQQLISAYRNLYIFKYGEEYGNRVAYNQVWKGMSEEMMKDSWGEPDKIESNIQNYGVFNQWYYGDVTFFFRDGKLIDWDETGKSSDDESIFFLNKQD